MSGDEQMAQPEFDPASTVGQHYEKGMLPYGGRVNCKGVITYAVSREQFYEKMRRLDSI